MHFGELQQSCTAVCTSHCTHRLPPFDMMSRDRRGRIEKEAAVHGKYGVLLLVGSSLSAGKKRENESVQRR